jgi:hypothetical protein
MRSEQVYRALGQGINRFEICQLVSKGVKALHKPGTRFEDSIGDVMEQVSRGVRLQPLPSISMEPLDTLIFQAA